MRFHTALLAACAFFERRAAYAVFGVLLISAPLRAAASPNATSAGDDVCMMCHKDHSLARSVGRSGDLSVDLQALGTSGHGKLHCVGCHRDANGAKHPVHLAKVKCADCHQAQADTLAAGAHRTVGVGGNEAGCHECHAGPHQVQVDVSRGRAQCGRCHAKEVADYETSVHGLARVAGDADAATCKDCHGTAHATRKQADSLATISHQRIADTCARCHADRKLMTKRKITIPEAVELFRNSAHGRSSDPQAARCNDCHDPHRMKRATDPASPIFRANIPTLCERCHAKEAAAYRGSVHGQALRRGVLAAPVCTDCHGEHMIRGPKDLSSPVAAGHVVETCSRCHEAAGIRETYGLPAGRLSSYRDSFHGLAARGGSVVVANCASCHGYHDILPSTDPRSMISADNIGRTCGHCHPGAGEKFTIGPVHVAMTTRSQPTLFWARIIYLLLIAATIGFMAAHNGAHFVRHVGHSLAAQMGKVPPHAHAAGRWFLRMTALERIQHFLLATSFFTLVFTGFALKFPEAPVFRWIAQWEGGYAWRAIVHRVAAAIMVAVSLFHILYLFTARGRRLLADLAPGPKDAAEMMQNSLYLFGLRRTPVKFERFGYIEKAEYWALIWGTIVMTVTGLALWFENSMLHAWPKWTLDLATIVHYYEAWLAFLAIVVWHLYMNIANPEVYPMNWTWLTGRISEAQLQHEHGGEYERITAPGATEAERAVTPVVDLGPPVAGVSQVPDATKKPLA